MVTIDHDHDDHREHPDALPRTEAGSESALRPDQGPREARLSSGPNRREPERNQVSVTLVDTGAAAVAVDRAPSTVRWWAYSGRITPRGHDHRGRTLYALADIRRTARTTNRRPST